MYSYVADGSWWLRVTEDVVGDTSRKNGDVPSTSNQRISDRGFPFH
jgi:hypothetical protein